MFFVCKRGALARRAAWHKKVDTRVNLSLDQTPQRGFVERTIAEKRSDKRSAGTCKHDVAPSFFSTQFAENFAKFVNASFANSPARRLERPARKAFAAPRRMSQRDGIRGRIEANLMRAGSRAGAVSRQ